VSLDQAMDDALRAADEAARREGPAGLSTGFPSVDAVIGGMEDGTVTVVAGRPAMGKSALGWQWALWAAQTGIGVLAVSLEMSARELGRRALCAATGIPITRLKAGRHSTEEMARLVEAQKRLAGLPLTIEDGGGLTAAMISMRARSAKRRHGLGLIMIDHLHIVAAADGDARHGPTHAIGNVSTAMKRLAKEFDVPVLLLAQLNRGVEGREDKRPTLADLRQSGTIEQDADAVGFLFREEYYLPCAEPPRDTDAQFHARLDRHRNAKQRLAGKAELIFAKVRDGAPCTVNLAFDGPAASFQEIPNAED
jgi:replicative DNA helicase